jgi:hypothetical protein
MLSTPVSSIQFPTAADDRSRRLCFIGVLALATGWGKTTLRGMTQLFPKNCPHIGLFLSILRTFLESLPGNRFRDFPEILTDFPQPTIGKSHPNSQLSNSRSPLLHRFCTAFSYVGNLILSRPVDLPSPFWGTYGRILPHRYETPGLALDSASDGPGSTDRFGFT